MEKVMKTSNRYLFLSAIAIAIEESGLEPVFSGYGMYIIEGSIKYDILPNFGFGKIGIKMYDSENDIFSYAGEYDVVKIHCFKQLLKKARKEAKVFNSDVPF